MEKLKRGVFEVEVEADALRAARERSVALDIRRQGVRQALATMRREEKDAAAVHAKGLDSAPAREVWMFKPGGVILCESRDSAKAKLEAEQMALEAAVHANAAEVKRALRALDDKGGASVSSVGPGLLRSFLNLNDGKSRGSTAYNTSIAEEEDEEEEE